MTWYLSRPHKALSSVPRIDKQAVVATSEFPQERKRQEERGKVVLATCQVRSLPGIHETVSQQASKQRTTRKGLMWLRGKHVSWTHKASTLMPSVQQQHNLVPPCDSKPLDSSRLSSLCVPRFTSQHSLLQRPKVLWQLWVWALCSAFVGKAWITQLLPSAWGVFLTDGETETSAPSIF